MHGQFRSRVWYIPPTRARESLGLPSPRDFPRAKPEGNPEGKANPGSPELLLEVYHSLLLYLLGQIFIPPHKNREGMTIPPRKNRGGMTIPPRKNREGMTIPPRKKRGGMELKNL